MDLYDFTNTFIQAVARSSALDDWCAAYFGRGAAVFGNVRSARLPAREDMPYVIFHSPESIKHQERRINEYVLGVDLALNYDELKMRAEANLQETGGLELVLDMAELIETAIEGALPARFVFGRHLTADNLGMLPEVHAYIDYEFQEKITIGTDPMD